MITPRSNGQVVKAQIFQTRRPEFETNGWLRLIHYFINDVDHITIRNSWGLSS